jgi:hypothetical protein
VNCSELVERLGQTELRHVPIEGKRVTVELVVHIRVAIVQAEKGLGRELIHHAAQCPRRSRHIVQLRHHNHVADPKKEISRDGVPLENLVILHGNFHLMFAI